MRKGVIMNTIKYLFKVNKSKLKIGFRRYGCNAKWYSAITDEFLDIMEKNVIARQHDNNIPQVRSLLSELKQNNDKDSLESSLLDEIRKLPNSSHPRAMQLQEPKELLQHKPKETHEKCVEFSEICKKFNLFRMDNLGNFSGHKSYYLQGPLAQLEQALVNYALDNLMKNGFKLVSVPDILEPNTIESCGMKTNGDRTQVYKLESGDCLSGTAEMALAGLFANNVYSEEDLPIKVAAASRCYRAETSGLRDEKGIYRVHQFTKVEMFSICTETQSEEMLEYFKNIQIELFKGLELNFRLLDMPAVELGASAYQKYDIEAWMPGRKMFGEISSCSNCTDYQTTRLKIRYHSKDNQIRCAHSVNGTAAAIPRLLISIVESYQNEEGNIVVPKVLRDFTQLKEISKSKKLPGLKLVKYIKM